MQKNSKDKVETEISFLGEMNVTIPVKIAVELTLMSDKKLSQKKIKEFVKNYCQGIQSKEIEIDDEYIEQDDSSSGIGNWCCKNCDDIDNFIEGGPDKNNKITKIKKVKIFNRGVTNEC